jgi:hypothetical protein
MYLKRIPEKELFQFVKERFASTKIKVSDEVLYKIIEVTENIPYYVQMLSHELWDYSILKKEIEEKDVQIVLNQLISQQSQNFYLEWSRLILSKRRLLKAIATSGGKNILSKKFLTGNEMEYPSSVYRTLLALNKEGYLDRENDTYYITDLLFREWIKKFLS